MKHTEPMTRKQIALWNSAAFLLMLAFTHYTARFLYPGVFYPSSGISHLMLITAIVGLVLGPVLVSYLWVPGKKGLWLDMTVMGLLQVMFWSGCLWLLYSQRPVWLVFAQDRFVVLRADEIDTRQIPAAITQHPKPGHPQLVIASQPEDPAFREQIMFDAMNSGIDIERYAQLWSKPDRENLQSITDSQAAITKYYNDLDGIEGELLLIGTRHDLLVRWDAATQGITAWRDEPDTEYK